MIEDKIGEILFTLNDIEETIENVIDKLKIVIECETLSIDMKNILFQVIEDLNKLSNYEH